jgi:hypothetical protein
MHVFLVISLIKRKIVGLIDKLPTDKSIKLSTDRLKAIFHCGRFARAGGATSFHHVKNQSRGYVKKVECSSTFMACPLAFKRTKNAQDRQLQRKLSNVCSARAGKATAMENCLNLHSVWTKAIWAHGSKALLTEYTWCFHKLKQTEQQQS